MEQLDESFKNLHYLPIIASSILPLTFSITYAIAVKLNHVPSVLALISDTGTFLPESCIFSQLLNIASVLIGLVIYIRYLQTEQICTTFKLPASISNCNKTGLSFGIFTSIGLSVVANFQETSAIIVHGAGAFVCFGCGTVYFLLQAWISCTVRPRSHSSMISHLRCFLALANTILLFLIFGTAIIAVSLYDGDDTTQWTAKDAGWKWHLATVITEWLCTSSFCLYILTFSQDFRNFRLTQPKVYMDRN